MNSIVQEMRGTAMGHKRSSQSGWDAWPNGFRCGASSKGCEYSSCCP
jgi:hypothetical protein